MMTDTKIKDCRFHYIAIRASDFDKSLAFYQQPVIIINRNGISVYNTIIIKTDGYFFGIR